MLCLIDDIDFFAPSHKIRFKSPTSCPPCGKKASRIDSIQSMFGFRKMKSNLWHEEYVIRVQSWCRECRKKSAKGVLA